MNIVGFTIKDNVYYKRNRKFRKAYNSLLKERDSRQRAQKFTDLEHNEYERLLNEANKCLTKMQKNKNRAYSKFFDTVLLLMDTLAYSNEGGE